MPVPVPTACAASLDPGFVGLRRLRRIEYDNTVRDLLGDASRPASAFPSDDSVLAEQSTVSPLFFEKHDAVVERLVEEAWSRDLAGKQPPAARIMVCPLKPGDTACARSIVSAFARRAWRRPVTAAELEPYFGLIGTAEKAGDDNAVGVKLALQALLTAPHFLFRVEPEGAMRRALTAHELAVRLSYLLWSSQPDARLSELADSGALLQPGTVSREIERLLADPKASAFAESFAGYWLATGNIVNVHPSPEKFKEWDEALAQAMTAETTRVLRSFIDEGRNVADLLDADFTFLNDRLARHYGLALPASQAPASELRRAPLAAGPRRGLLAHGGILTMTSGSTSTSPVKRGKWVLSNVLCAKPPPPPEGVDTKPPMIEVMTERERLAIHRSNPQCAACHALIDPIGLGLENFDLVGRYRQRYDNGATVDASGELVGAGPFGTFEELRGLLKQDPRLYSCLADNLFTYAVGRQLADSDACVHKAVVDSYVKGGGKVKDLIAGIVGSPAFTDRRPESPGGAP